MDLVSSFFSSLRVNQASVNRIEASAPWGVRADSQPDIRFILVLRGHFVIRLRAQSGPLHLGRHDLFLQVGGSDFIVSDEESSPVSACSAFNTKAAGKTIRVGGGGKSSSFIVGRFVMGRLEKQTIMQVLPGTLHVCLDGVRSRSFRSVFELISSELEDEGLASMEMVNRLCEMLFIHVVRVYCVEKSQQLTGWLAGMADTSLAKLLQALHLQLAKKWTVDSMAAYAGMSRSSFAARFKKVTGQSPMDYLAQWRVHQACVLLRTTDLKVHKIAKRVGYASESAFTKVFKRLLQSTPNEFLANSPGDGTKSLHR